MIKKEYIEKLIEDNYLEEGVFIVEIKISNGSEIVVLVDKEEGINITDCIKISRTIESSLDREEEDFKLDVSSPGLTAPFKVLQQYNKNIGRQIEVLNIDGERRKGKLLNVSDTKIEIEEKEKVRVEKKKKKEIITKSIMIDIDQIKLARIIIDFKKS